MKKFKAVLSLCMVLAMCALLLAGCGGSGDGDSTDSTSGSSSGGNATYEFSLTIHDTEEALKTQYIQKWADEVYEATDGQVEIVVYSGGTLAASTDALDAVKSGLADIGVCFTSFFPDQFPLLEVISLPMLGITSAEVGTQVLWDIWDEYTQVQDELADYKVLMLYSGPDNPISTAGTAIHTKDDLTNLNLRVTSGTPADMVEAWGGNGQSVSSSEIYEQLEKKGLDGCLLDFTGISSWNLYEVLDHYTIFEGTGFYVQPWVILMNEDSWSTLPEDLQTIVEEVSSRDMSIGFGQLNDEESNSTIETIGTDYPDSEVIYLTEDELDTFRPQAEEYVSEWVEGCGKGNFATADEAQAFVDRVLELAVQYAE